MEPERLHTHPPGSDGAGRRGSVQEERGAASLPLSTLVTPVDEGSDAPAVVELWAGVGQLSKEFEKDGFALAVMCERDPRLCDLLQAEHRGGRRRPRTRACASQDRAPGQHQGNARATPGQRQDNARTRKRCWQ